MVTDPDKKNNNHRIQSAGVRSGGVGPTVMKRRPAAARPQIKSPSRPFSGRQDDSLRGSAAVRSFRVYFPGDNAFPHFNKIKAARAIRLASRGSSWRGTLVRLNLFSACQSRCVFKENTDKECTVLTPQSRPLSCD